MPVQRRMVPSTDGTSAVELTINLEEAPVPERRYYGELGSATRQGEKVRLVFGQQKLGVQELRSAVVILLSSDAVQHFLKTIDTFQPNINAFVARNEITPEPLVNLLSEPDQTIVVAGNFLAMAFHGREACIDVYQISAWAIRAVAATNSIAIDPIVRIDTSTALMKSVIDNLIGLAKELPPEAR